MACERGVVVRMERGVGEFVVEGMPLVSVDRAPHGAESLAEEVSAAYGIGRHRTVEQDAGFGIRQIVDIALKALSPGVNETTTALMCVDYLSSLLCDLARRRMPEAHRFEGEQLRVVAITPTFEQMLAESYDPIRRNAEGNVEVLARILEALATIAECTTDAGRRRAVLEQTRLVAEAAERGLTSPRDRTLVADGVQRIEDFVGSRIRPRE
jgi:uncharacterized membrane protein